MAWLSGWSYRKEISVTGQTGAGTDFQVPFSIGDSAGGDFHLEGHCTNFPQDIAVTDNDGSTPLDFWIEDITADPIKMWVEVADDLGSNQTIYVYYGKSGATTNSNGPDTFLAFFDGDSTGWTEVDPNGHITFQNDRLEFNGLTRGESAYVYQAITPIEVDWVAEWTTVLTSKMLTSHVFTMGISENIDDLYSHSGDSVGFDYYYGSGVNDQIYIFEVDEGSASNVCTSGTSAPNTRYMRAYRTGDMVYVTAYSDEARTSAIESTLSKDITGVTAANLDNYFLLSSLHATGTAYMTGYIDDHKCRKYLATEPAFSSAGSEETNDITDVYLALSQNLSTSGLGQANAQGPVILSNTLATVDGGGANASAPITVDDLLGLIEVGQAQTDQNLVLTSSLLFTTGADAVAQSTLDISEILSILQAGTATSSADVTLNEILTVLQTTANEFDVDVSLSEILSILQAGLSDSEGNLALSELLNISNSATAISSGSLSLSEILTILESTTGLFYKDVSLLETLSVLQNGLVSSGGSLSILNVLSILSASQSTAEASASFVKNLSLSQTTAEITQSYLTLAYDLALNTQSVSTAASTLALAINSGISATVMVNFEGALPLSQSLELSSVGPATLQSELSFNNILSISILAEALASAGMSLNMVESVITNGTLVSITVTTPEGRTVIIGVEIRTEIIPGENRMVIVPEKNRMTII